MHPPSHPSLSLAHGREFLAIPGPSVIPDPVLQAMNRPAVNIYEGEIVALTEGLIRDLRPVARTQAARPFIYIANGHGAWEAAVANTCSRGDRVLVLNCGRFGAGWAQNARGLGVEAQVLEAEPGRATDPQAVLDALRAAPGVYKAVLMCQVDTASGALTDVQAVRAAIDAAGSDALLMVDVIASQGCMAFEMDAWGVDVVVGGAQKGLMTPPGLAFTWANDKALAAEATADLSTGYYSWAARMGGAQYQHFCGTAPIHHLYGLRAALDLLLAEGMEGAWTRHAALARAVRAAVAAWSADGPLDFYVRDPAQRADCVTCVTADGADAEAFRAFCMAQLGLVLGVALDPLSGRAFRIGHMGWLNPPMVMGALGAAEVGLRACGVRIGDGALEAASRALAEHFTQAEAAKRVA